MPLSALLRRRRWPRGGLSALLAVAALLLTTGCARETPFNAQNARAHVERLAGAIGSRAAGTAANQEARAYLIETLQLYGFDVRVQEADAQWPAAGTTARVANIIAIRNGELRDAIGLVAHYDSVTAGPGAADNGFGVAVVLEAARVLATRQAPRYSLMVLLTDAEEDGLMGARALIQDEEVRGRLRTYLNVEAVGSGRPVPLFEAGPGVGPALRAWAQSPRPDGGSYMQSVYDALPNDTDFSVLSQLDIFGLNFAAVGDSYAYHTDRDRSDRVDARALADMGAVAVDIVSRLDGGPLDGSDARPAYFSLFDRTAAVTTVTSVRVLGVVAVLLALICLVGLVRRSLRRHGLLAVVMTFAWATLATGGVVLALIGSVWLLRLARAELHPWYASPWRLFFFMTTMVLVVTWLVRRGAAVMPVRVRPIGTPSAVWLTTLPAWIAATVLGLIYAPAASYLATMPLLLAAALLPLGIWREPIVRFVSALVAIGTWSLWATDGWTLLEFAVAVFGRLPIVTPTWAFPALFMGLGVFLWPPVLAMLVGRVTLRVRHGLAASILMTVLVVSAALVLLADAYTPERPQRRSANYVEDHVRGEAFWRLTGNEPGVDIAAGPRNVQWQPTSVDQRLRPDLPPGAFVFEGRVDMGQVQVPARVTSSITRHATGADIEITVAAHVMDRLSVAFILPESVVPTSTSLVGRTWNGRWLARHVNVPASGLTWRGTVPLGQADALAGAEVWQSWPDLPGADPASGLPPWLTRERTAWATATTVKIGIQPDDVAPLTADDLGESRYAPTALGRVHYLEAGTGDTALVFLHDWGGAARQWRGQLPLARGRRAIFVDLPGHGQSEVTGGPHTMAAMADALHGLLQSAGVSRAVVVAHGMSALIARDLASRAADRIEGVVVVDGTLLPLLDDTSGARAFAEMMRAEDPRRLVADLLELLFVEATPAHVREEILEQAGRTSVDVLVSSMKDAAASLAGPPPPVMTQPMLALMTRSPATPADQEAQIRQRVAQLDYRGFDGAGHYLMLERPGEVNDAIAGFILGRGLLQ